MNWGVSSTMRIKERYEGVISKVSFPIVLETEITVSPGEFHILFVLRVRAVWSGKVTMARCGFRVWAEAVKRKVFIKKILRLVGSISAARE